MIEGQETALLTTTQGAVLEGKGIVDGGATRTFGSTFAMEQIMQLNQNKHGSSRLLKIDTKDRPTFGFGNSSSDQCCSKVTLALEAGKQGGEMGVHLLDKGQGPVLISVETLRRLGAVIDYEEDTVVFKRLNASRLVDLERSAAGHQLLPLTEDLLAKGRDLKSDFPGLRAFLKLGGTESAQKEE